MKLSICTTTYNNAVYLPRFFEGIKKINFDEIVFVDNFSKDSTEKLIKNFEKEMEKFGKKVIYIKQKCSRGKGRQIAFENSSYELIATVDTDTFYYSSLINKIIKNYNKFYPSAIVTYQSFGIYPRKTLEEVGGWRDLNINEDFDLWVRLLKIKKFYLLPVSVGEDLSKMRRSSIKRETRYSNFFSSIFRYLRNERDLLIARNCSFFEFLEESKQNKILLALSYPLAKFLTFFSKTKPIKISKKESNREFWYKNCFNYYLMPSELGLSNELLELRLTEYMKKFVEKENYNKNFKRILEFAKEKNKIRIV
jgi:glycosyltransferase involved in cell wall biosynthesis